MKNAPELSYGMYTPKGDAAIHGFVIAAKAAKMSWPEAHGALYDLAASNRKELGEATDTVVRECVYDALGMTTNFYV